MSINRNKRLHSRDSCVLLGMTLEFIIHNAELRCGFATNISRAERISRLHSKHIARRKANIACWAHIACGLPHTEEPSPDWTNQLVVTPNSKNITIFVNDGMQNTAKHIRRLRTINMPTFFF